MKAYTDFNALITLKNYPHTKLLRLHLFLLDPYDDEHLKMLKEFEKRNGIPEKMSEDLEKLRLSVSKETYLNQKKEKSENEIIEENLFLEKESKIVDICHLHVEKDIRLARLNMAPIKATERSLISYVSNYAFNTLNVKTIVIETSPQDKSLISYLDSAGYENLGEQDGEILYLKEKEEMKDFQRIIS